MSKSVISFLACTVGVVFAVSAAAQVRNITFDEYVKAFAEANSKSSAAIPRRLTAVDAFGKTLTVEEYGIGRYHFIKMIVGTVDDPPSLIIETGGFTYSSHGFDKWTCRRTPPVFRMIDIDANRKHTVERITRKGKTFTVYTQEPGSRSAPTSPGLVTTVDDQGRITKINLSDGGVTTFDYDVTIIPVAIPKVACEQ